MSVFRSLAGYLGLTGGDDVVAENRRLIRRVEALEAQVEALARHTDADLSRLSPPPRVSAGVRDLVREGKTIQAVKLHREETGLGLKAAKDDIDAVVAGRE